jgi:hypothetical protein
LLPNIVLLLYNGKGGELPCYTSRMYVAGRYYESVLIK